MVRSFYCSKCGQENKNIVVEDNKATFVCDKCGYSHEIIFHDTTELASEEFESI